MSRKRYPEEFKIEEKRLSKLRKPATALMMWRSGSEPPQIVSIVGSGDMGLNPAILRERRRSQTRFVG